MGIIIIIIIIIITYLILFSQVTCTTITMRVRRAPRCLDTGVVSDEGSRVLLNKTHSSLCLCATVEVRREKAEKRRLL